MPFKSLAQEKWAFSTGQPFAKKWASMTNQKALPRKLKGYSPDVVKMARSMHK